ncbi:MAG: hypothetical protein KJ838_00885, partial [Candidatus Omnitrophica bacterium]|nr:hypothetical protein [Candidatus Omnitrophota bacterium]
EKYSKPREAKEILALALKRESASVKFYEDMMRHDFSDSIKEFISALRNEELVHKLKIENKLKEFGT